MLTNEDIVKISQSTRKVINDALEDYYDKLEMDEKFNTLLTSVDGIAKNMKEYQTELAIHAHSTKGLEHWATNAGNKIGLEYTR